MALDLLDTTVEREAFAAKLRERDERTEHQSFHLGDLTFTTGKNLGVEIDGKNLVLTNGSFGQLAKMLDVPTPYARRIPDDLLAYTMNYFIKEKKNQPLAGLIEQEHVRSFMGANDPYLSLNEMFTEVVEEAGDDFEIIKAYTTDIDTGFALLPKAYATVIEESDMFGGVQVNYSDSWNTHPEVNAYLWRLVCSNGMTRPVENKKFRVSGRSTDDIRRQLREYVRLSIDQLPTLIESFEKLLEESVENYANMIRRICTEYKLSAKVQTRLIFWANQPEFLITIRDGQIKNMHDIVNLITYVGSHDLELTEDVRRQLLEIGGNLTMSHNDRCTSCGSVF